jgi:hypothetical protein
VRRFKIVAEHLRPLHIEDLTLRPTARPVRVAGLICATEPAGALIEKSEDVLIDLEGIPVLLPAALARHAAASLEPTSEVLVIGQIQRGPGSLLLHADGLWRLADLEDQATKVSAIKLHLAGENRQTLKLLIALAKSFPGNTKLQLANYPGRQGWTYRRLARQGVFFCSPFYQGLCKILPPEAVELFGPEGEPLLVKTTQAENEELEENDLPAQATD